MRQGSEVAADFKDYISTSTAIATGWATKRNILLSPEGDTAIATLAGRDGNGGFIGEFYHAI
jgi:hypothetical protein